MKDIRKLQKSESKRGLTELYLKDLKLMNQMYERIGDDRFKRRKELSVERSDAIDQLTDRLRMD